jgi:methionyl-tRNA formyltransferase
MTSWPGAFTWMDGKMLKIWEAEACENNENGAVCGQVISSKDTLLVQTGDGILSITSLQLPGKKRMSAADYLRGHPLGRKA